MKNISWISKFVKQVASHSNLCGFGCVKGHFRQRFRDQKPWDQFETNWTLNLNLLPIKKTIFLKVQWVLIATTVWGSMELAMSPLKLILKKRRIWVCSQQCPQSIECLPSSQNLRVKIIKKKEKKTKKSRTLNPSLHFDSPNPKLSFKPFFSFFSRTN
jgi:hypothetical protein